MPLFNRDKRESQDVPAERLPSTYASRLGYIGRQLDESDCRSAAVIEVSSNYIVRAIDKRSGGPNLSEVVQEDFDRGHQRKASRARPETYEMMFRVIGQDLDEWMATNIAIVERELVFEMVGWVHGTAAGRSTYVSIDRVYPRSMLQQKAEQLS